MLKVATRRVHVVIEYKLQAQRGFHMIILEPTYLLYSYMDSARDPTLVITEGPALDHVFCCSTAVFIVSKSSMCYMMRDEQKNREVSLGVSEIVFSALTVSGFCSSVQENRIL